jgi:general secretion pathway protein G
MHRKKRKPLTLLEIMIVIFLIGLIGSVIGYNMKGSLDEGRYFKTEQSAKQVRSILLLEVAKGTPIDEVVAKPREFLKNAGIIKSVDKTLKDGWGNEFNVTRDGEDNIKVSTDKYEAYRVAKNKPRDDED